MILLGRVLLIAVMGLEAGAPAFAQQPAETSSSATLGACAAITNAQERLACYDKAAARTAGKAPTSAPATVAPQPSAPAPSSGSPPPARPAIGTKEAFGLNAVEHPAAPKSPVDAIKGRIARVSYDAYGRETVALEDGPVWQLAGSDALLVSGDSVTIERAALGSFVMTTPSGRQHRVKRLR